MTNSNESISKSSPQPGDSVSAPIPKPAPKKSAPKKAAAKNVSKKAAPKTPAKSTAKAVAKPAPKATAKSPATSKKTTAKSPEKPTEKRSEKNPEKTQPSQKISQKTVKAAPKTTPKAAQKSTPKTAPKTVPKAAAVKTAQPVSTKNSTPQHPPEHPHSQNTPKTAAPTFDSETTRQQKTTETSAPSKTPAVAAESKPAAPAVSSPSASSSSSHAAPVNLSLAGKTAPATPAAAEKKPHSSGPSPEEIAKIESLVQLLKAGGKNLQEALDLALTLPWILTVNATCQVWLEMKPTPRREWLRLLTKSEHESAPRLRASLTRGLHRIDPETALKMLVAFITDLPASDKKKPETKKAYQLFWNVFIGKQRPWICYVSTKSLRPADTARLLQVILMTCFDTTFSHTPFLSQAALLEWFKRENLFEHLSEQENTLITKAIARWNSRTRRQFRSSGMPDFIIQALRSSNSKTNGSPEDTQDSNSSTKPASETPDAKPASIKEPVSTSSSSPASKETSQTASQSTSASKSDPEAHPKKSSSKPATKPAQKSTSKSTHADLPERPGKPERTERPERTPASFQQLLKQLDSQYQSLQSELEHAKSDLRRARSQSSSRRHREIAPEVISPVHYEDRDTLIQHNERLEATIVDLQQQWEALSSHSEDIAASMIHDDGRQQLLEFLQHKLANSYQTFHNMLNENRGSVHPMTERELLAEIFETLQTTGVKFENK